jgi:hypothetical protein
MAVTIKYHVLSVSKKRNSTDNTYLNLLRKQHEV